LVHTHKMENDLNWNKINIKKVDGCHSTVMAVKTGYHYRNGRNEYIVLQETAMVERFVSP